MAKSRIGWLRQITSGSVLVYTALVTGWFIAHRLIGDGFWLLALINAFALYLFAPLPLIALAAALSKQPAAWCAVLIVMLLFCGLFGDTLTPPSPVAHAGGEGHDLTVMTYNVLYTTADAAPIVATIARATPDLIAFQELTPQLATALEEEIGANYSYRTPMHPGCRAEVAIWSRYPLRVEDVDKDVLCRVRPVVVDLGGQFVRVVDIHAWPYSGLDRKSVEQSFHWRREQVDWLLTSIEGQPEPLILLGDMNSAPMHQVYHMLSAHFEDAFCEAGWGLGHTFPATGGYLWGIPYPDRLVRIDHIFHSDDWRAVKAWVAEWDGSSDHRPVIAQLRLSRTN